MFVVGDDGGGGSRFLVCGCGGLVAVEVVVVMAVVAVVAVFGRRFVVGGLWLVVCGW